MSDSPEFPFTLAVDRIGCHVMHQSLQADPQQCAAVAKRLKLEKITSLKAEFRLRCGVQPGLFEVIGSARAEVTQICVVTGDAFDSTVSTAINSLFSEGEIDLEEPVGGDEWDDIEAVTDGRIDLGELAVQHISLALDPYPRKPGAKWTLTEEALEKKPSPFGVLKVIRTDD